MNKQIELKKEVLYYFPNFEEQNSEIKEYMIKVIKCFLNKTEMDAE